MDETDIITYLKKRKELKEYQKNYQVAKKVKKQIIFFIAANQGIVM